MELIDFLGIGIVGAGLSILMQVVKNYVNTEPYNRAIVLVLAIAIGATYYFLQDTDLWVTIVGILGASQIVYNYVVKTS